MIFFEGEAKVFSSSSDDSASEEGRIGIGVHDGRIGTGVHDGRIGTGVHDGKVAGWIARLAGVCSTRCVDESGEDTIMRISEASISVCKVSDFNM